MTTNDLAKAARQRRIELGIDQEDVKRIGGPSTAITSKIENGSYEHSDRSRSLAKLDRALRWVPGSAEGCYLNGTSPVRLGDESPPDLARLVEMVEELLSIVRERLPVDRS